MSVAVIIPVYRDVRFLAQAIDSVLCQTYPVQEICIVDDGSPDSVVAEIGSRFGDPRIRCVRLAVNRGLAFARNCGVRSTTSQYLAFLDADDFWEPDKIEKQVSICCDSLEQPSLKIATTHLIFHESNRPPQTQEVSLAENTLGLLFSKLFLVSPSTMVLSRETFEKLGGFDENLRFAEDWDFLVRAHLKNVEFVLVPEFLTHLHVHSGSLSRSYLPSWEAVYLRKKYLDVARTEVRITPRMVAHSMSSLSRWMQARQRPFFELYLLWLAVSASPGILVSREFRGNLFYSLSGIGSLSLRRSHG